MSKEENPQKRKKKAHLFRIENDESIETIICQILVERLGVEEHEVMLSARIAYDLGADSLDAIELIMAIEEELDLEIPDEVAENFVTVGDLIRYLEDTLHA